MNFNKLIINNVVRSARTYGSYFLSASFSVFVFFTFAMLSFHPKLDDGISASSGDVSRLAGFGMQAAQVLIVILSIIFLWYSFWTFVKARKRDLGVYLMLGMRPMDLRRTLFGENMLIGVGAILTGMGFGLLFMKAMLIVIQNLLHISSGLSFYWPIKALIITPVVFLILFLLVSVTLTLKIETENLNQLGKSDELPQPMPKTHPLLVVLALILIGGGYGSLVYMVREMSSLWPLLICVLATVAGTFLFFNQVIVYFYKWARKRPSFLKGNHILSVSEGIYKAKENANMFSLLACTAAVALVGISVTAALGSYETGSRNSASAAFVLSSEIGSDQGANPAEKNAQDISKQLRQAGYKPITSEITSYPMQYYPIYEGKKDTEGTYAAYVVKASDYNRVAKALGGEALHPKAGELISPASSLREQEEIKKLGEAKAREEIYGLIDGGVETKLTIQRTPVRFRIANMYRFYVADDELAAKIYAPAETYHPMAFYLVDIKDWQEAATISEKIIDEMDKKQAAFTKEINKLSEEELSAEESEKRWNELASQYAFNFESKYQVWQGQRQDNGLILIIGILLGGTFFIFAASILYFRLFGDLDKEGRYHRSLYQIGLRPSDRHKLVIKQMLVMYFLPMLVAMIHGTMAYWGIVQIAMQPLWHYYFIIIACYFAVFILLFVISCWRYLIHLDLRAESSQQF